jgi:hypothetical protein
MLDDNPLTQFFPSQDPPQKQAPQAEISDTGLNARTSRALEEVLQPSLSAEESSLTSKTTGYEAFRTAEALSDIATPLYFYTARVAGINLNTLVRAVFVVERRILPWQNSRKVRAN